MMSSLHYSLIGNVMQPVPNMPFKFTRKSMVLKVQQGECCSSMKS